jgi:hypothetical protein
MVTPPTAKRHQSGEINSFQNNNKPSSSTSSVDQVAIQGGSPASMKKPTITNTIPLPLYKERTKVGEVVVAYPSNRTSTVDDDDRNTTNRARCIISTTNENVGRYNITKPYRHMFTTMEERAAALEQLLVAQKEAIIEHHVLSTTVYSNSDSSDKDDNLTDAFAPLEEVNVARQEKVTCIGRICNEVRVQIKCYCVEREIKIIIPRNVAYKVCKNNISPSSLLSPTNFTSITGPPGQAKQYIGSNGRIQSHMWGG